MKLNSYIGKALLTVILTVFSINGFAQTIGKFSTYYDQRELLFETLPTSHRDIIF